MRPKHRGSIIKNIVGKEFVDLQEKERLLKEGSIIKSQNIGFTADGEVIVKLYNTDICFDLTNNWETDKDVIDTNYKISNKTLEIFTDKDKLYEIRLSKFKNYPPESFIIKLKDLLEVASHEKEWKKQENLQQSEENSVIVDNFKKIIASVSEKS